MANQTIPITLSPGVAPPDVAYTNFNELLSLVCQYVSGAIRADVTFIPQLATDPATFQGQLIFNIIQRVFKGWDAGTGTYKAVTEYVVGDVKNSFIGTDSVSTGWVLLDGRAIAAVAGISTAQRLALESLFGAGGNLPTVSPANVVGLPAGNAFGSIPWPTILPPAGTFSDLTFTNPVTDGEAEGFAGETETLRDTVNNVFILVQAIQEVCQQQLSALNNSSSPTLYSLVFCGYP